MKKNLLKWIIPCFLLTGCSSVANLQTHDNATKYPATNAKEINVYSTSRIEKEYVVIGQVVANADAGTDAKIPVEMLKKEAAKLGANAIIDLRLEVDYGYWLNAIKATGTAIRYK
ncbi:MAG: heavy metal-binding domain-containing protein [Bacteroidales bacterium]|nr:heavy metal-binding domain-containing protein [Bacteroidales bacterium]